MSKRALVSVYDKEEVVDFSKKLEKLGWEIISTGGTYKLLLENGVKAIEIDEVTGVKEMLEGRVKTLNPKIHGGILYKRDNEDHVKTIQENNINSIDMVVNNLYPFEYVLNNDNSTHEDLIENIDIGGPSMIRAAAKNYKDVLIVTDVKDYNSVIEYLEKETDSLTYRLNLAKKAFNYTAYYDSLISSYFNEYTKDEYPERLTMTYKKKENLRYGENPHQKAVIYETVVKEKDKVEIKQLHGKELSYNNYGDMHNGLQFIREFEEPAVVGIKHMSPCGIGVGKDIDEAYKKAYESDTVSIFGGVIVLNREVTKEIANSMNDYFLEIVIAPSYEKKAFEILSSKKNIRLIEVANLKEYKAKKTEYKETVNGIRFEEKDDVLFYEDLKLMTNRKPTFEELEELKFAWKACKCVSSNGIVLTKNGGTVGIGQGEVRRSWAVEEALERAKGKLEGAVMASDAFFFEDTVELLAEYGVKAAIQPGGSVKDEKVIELANKYDIAIVFTGIRHFKH